MQTWALTVRLLRTTLRGRMATAALVLFLLGLGAAAWLGARADHAAGVLLLFGLLVLTFVVAGAAVGAGSALPEDRVAGREEWLATLAPPAWKRRLAAVLSGWILAVGLGLAGGALIGALTHLVRDDVSLRAYAALPLPERAVSAGAEGPILLALPAFDPTLAEAEIDVRPRFNLYRHGRPVDRLQIRWRAGSAGGEREVSARGPVRFELPADATRLEVTSLTEGVQMRVVGARRLGGTRSVIAAMALAGLVLGAMAGTVAPIAVLVSRGTSGQTAGAAAFSLLLVGAARTSLLELALDLRPDGPMQAAPAVLRAIAWVAPDAAVFSVFGQVLAGRVPVAGIGAVPGSVLLYTLVAAVVACLPLPRRLRAGVNS